MLLIHILQNKIHKISFQIANQSLVEQRLSESALLSNVHVIQEAIKELSRERAEFSSARQLIENRQKQEIVFAEAPPRTKFYECEPGESIAEFIVLRHYAVAQVQREQAVYFALYNFRTEKFHYLRFSELVYGIDVEQLQQYESSFFRFSLSQPHQQTQLYNYNIGVRELIPVQQISFQGFDPAKYALER